jgi:hypothetical protein
MPIQFPHPIQAPAELNPLRTITEHTNALNALDLQQAQTGLANANAGMANAHAQNFMADAQAKQVAAQENARAMQLLKANAGAPADQMITILKQDGLGRHADALSKMNADLEEKKALALWHGKQAEKLQTEKALTMMSAGLNELRASTGYEDAAQRVMSLPVDVMNADSKKRALDDIERSRAANLPWDGYLLKTTAPMQTMHDELKLKQDKELAAERSLQARDQLRSHETIAREQMTNAVKVANIGAGSREKIAAERIAAAPDKADKPLPQKAITELQDARDSASTITSLKDAFDPSYASKGVLGFGSDLQLSAGSVLGMDTDAVEWWKNYRKQVEIVERHAKFGASLSKNESASWRSADINPGMDAAVIKRNLATRAALAKKVLENTAQDYIDAGHPAEKIKAIAERQGPAVSTEKPVAPAAKGKWKYLGTE